MGPVGYPAGRGGPVPQIPQGGAFDRFLHWVWYGKAPGAGLGAVPGQFASSLDPRSRAGPLNLVSMFAGGGPKSEEILGGSQFEPYSIQKAQAGGHVVFREGSKVQGVGGGRLHGSIGETLGTVAGRNSMRVNPQRVVSEHLNQMWHEGIQRRNINENMAREEAHQNSQAMLRRQSQQRTQLRNRVNDRLGAEPLTPGRALHSSGTNPMEHDYFDGPEFEHTVNHGSPHADPRVELLHRLVARRYQAQMGHNHRN